ERGRAKDALATFDRALKLDPDDVFVAGLRATALRVLRRRGAAETWTSLLEESFSRAREAIERDPNDSLARADAVGLLIDLDRVDDALQHARAAADADPTPAVLLLVVDAEARLGRYAESEETVRRVLHLDPAHAEALDQIAWLGAATASAEPAVGAARFGALAARSSVDCCAWAWAGIAALEQGRRADAKAAAEPVRRHQPAPCPSLDLLAARLG
ncbi:MAG TPA: hypothetical protein VK278_01690, partial [Gaiellaceae bacterium]|nr:hypothetical protein [Gaiellaceae bacterium]